MDNFTLKTKGNIEYYVCEGIPVTHAFSTRLGGVSSLSHTKSMNLAYGRGDSDETVNKNFSIFFGALGLKTENLIYMNQIHSCDVREITDGESGCAGSLDGMVTKSKNAVLCVKIADCSPIILCDKESGVIGACHAGWRGACGGIAKATVEKMVALGAKKENIRAAIGPCIHSCCYEIQEDFYLEVKKMTGDICDSFFTKREGKMFADIVKMNTYYLNLAGLKPENVYASEECTACSPYRFFSHRATKGKRGTMAAIITLG